MDDVLATRTAIMLAGLLVALWATWGIPRLLLTAHPDRPTESAMAGLGSGCILAIVAAILAFCPGHPPTTQVMLATVFVVLGASVWFGVWIRG